MPSSPLPAQGCLIPSPSQHLWSALASLSENRGWIERSDRPTSRISARPSHSGSKTFSRGISCGISRVIAPLIMNSPRNCPTPLNTLAYFLIRSPALCQLRWSNSHFHYQFDQFNIQPAWGLSSGDAAVCVLHKMHGVLHAISIRLNSTPPLLTSAPLSSH